MDATLLTDDSRQLTQEMMCVVQYDDIIAACNGEHYTMSLPVEDEETQAVVAALGMAIDSRLQACFVPQRGDTYERGERSFIALETCKRWKKGERVVYQVTLDCSISPESLPVLLNRLFDADCCCSLASSILMTLGFNDEGEFVGREEMGLD